MEGGAVEETFLSPVDSCFRREARASRLQLDIDGIKGQATKPRIMGPEISTAQLRGTTGQSISPCSIDIQSAAILAAAVAAFAAGKTYQGHGRLEDSFDRLLDPSDQNQVRTASRTCQQKTNRPKRLDSVE